MTLLVQPQREVEGPAGDQVAGGATLQLGVQSGIVFGGGSRGEDDMDVGVLGLESGDDLVRPDRQVIVAPAFDGQGNFLARRRLRRRRGRWLISSRLCGRSGLLTTSRQQQ